jgi:hypothetical protein
MSAVSFIQELSSKSVHAHAAILVLFIRYGLRMFNDWFSLKKLTFNSGPVIFIPGLRISSIKRRKCCNGSKIYLNKTRNNLFTFPVNKKASIKSLIEAFLQMIFCYNLTTVPLPLISVVISPGSPL